MTPAKALGRIATVIVAASASCTGTEVGNPVTEPVSVALTARSSSADVGLAFEDESDGGDGGAGIIVIEQIWVSLGDARFVIDDDCSARNETRVIVDGPFVADLAQGPITLSERLPQGNYCNVRVSLERAVGEDLPAALAGYSVLLHGHRDDGTPVVIRTRAKPDFVLHGRRNMFRVDDAQRALFLAFDAAAWLENVGIDTAVPNDEGEIVIEPGSEDARLRTFETNLRRSLSLFKDGNGNGALEPAEASDPLAD